MQEQSLQKNLRLRREVHRRKKKTFGTGLTLLFRGGILAGLACGSSESNQFNLSGLPDEGSIESETSEGEQDDEVENPNSSPTGVQDAHEDKDGLGDDESSSASPSMESTTGKPENNLVFDVAVPEPEDFPEDVDELEASYIWIANSSEGTVSKIDTRTIEEKGRYWVHSSMDPSTNPSRTSVDLNGNVAVSLRSGVGGVTKFYASRSSCKDKNGSGKIISSHNKEPLDWNKEECRAWHVEFDYAGQRGIAWTQGFLNPETGKYEGQNLWVTANSALGSIPTEVFLLNGETGDTIKKVVFGPEHMRPGASLGNGGYGGVVDSKGDFWFTPKTSNFLGHVSLETFEPTAYALQNNIYGAAYGIAIDSHDVIWTCADTIYRFDPETESWQSWSSDMGRPDVLDYAVHGGCMIDGNGILWAYGNPAGDAEQGVFGFDTETQQPIKNVPVPARLVGISIDFDGYVWGVELSGTRAFRIDPVRRNYQVYEGLVGAYTYSDMTGFALASTLPPGVE